MFSWGVIGILTIEIDLNALYSKLHSFTIHICVISQVFCETVCPPTEIEIVKKKIAAATTYSEWRKLSEQLDR